MHDAAGGVAEQGQVEIDDEVFVDLPSAIVAFATFADSKVLADSAFVVEPTLVVVALEQLAYDVSPE